jgi:DNA (cytosine-5)-methyltransferase 1
LISPVLNSTSIAISLFSGAGGLDLGVEAAAYRVVAAVEYDERALVTLNANRTRFFPGLRDEVEPLDITKLDPKSVMKAAGLRRGEVDLLVGGPPCVAFSKSGFHLEYKREGKDPRANLLDDYLRFLIAFRPRAYVMENVFGLAYKNQSAAWLNRLTSGLKEAGYGVSYGILNAADYGVPQNRQRLFIIGARGKTLQLPQATHWGAHERRVPPPNVGELLRHKTAAEALKGLRTRPEAGEEVNGLYGHLLPEIPPGGNYLHFTAKAGHPKALFEWRSRYWTFLLKLDPNRPAPTIQGQPGPYVGPFHWENRRLRKRELQRLQGFPDEYVLVGDRRAVQLQVGNSVPPPLGEVVAASIREQMS